MLLFSICYGASVAGIGTPSGGAPACTIVYASGYLKTTDFLNVGWRMVLVSIVVMLAAASVYWPLLGV